MIPLILFAVLPVATRFEAPALVLPALQDEVGQKIAEAGADVAKLLELAKQYQTAENDDAARAVFKRILDVDPNHEEAHKGLRHHLYDGKWFESYAELSKYRREETARMKEKGLVRVNDQWVPEADAPYLKMGWVKEGETWVHPVKQARAKEEAEKTAAGWKRQLDLVWAAPEEQARWEEGLWKCGDQWLTKDEANQFHAELGKWWTVPGEAFLTYSTCDLDTVAWINWYADKTKKDLVRLFGVEPAEKPTLVVLKSNEQYNEFATGSQAAQLPPTEVDGFSSLHFAFFAEIFADVSTNPPEYKGCGVAFWDKANPQLEAWGPFAIRHAAGLSYGEAIDPSWNAVSDFMSGGAGGQPSTQPFWAEKGFPRWLHYGAASYVERFMKNEEDAENPWAWRKWAIGELKKAASFDSFDKIFAFQLTLDDIPSSTRLIHQAGLVTAFVLDGECKSVVSAHEALKDCLRSNQGVREAAQELEEVIRKHEQEFMSFADQ